MSEWQPIETAPDDGTLILVWLKEKAAGTQMQVMRTGRVPTIGTHFKWDMPEPTHWMPLPEPPEEGDE